MVRTIKKAKANLAPSTSKSVKRSARKTKTEEKLSNGFDDTENETAQSKASETKVLEKAESGEKQTDMNPDEDNKNSNVDETVESDNKNIEISKKPKADQNRKRKIPTTVKEVENKEAVPNIKAKRRKVLLEIPKISSVSGKVFVIGGNEVGQLGLGEDVTEKKRPALLELPYSIVDIAAGGMHSVCLTERGEVITFGCNDEGALGRITSEEGSEMIPQTIDIPERIIQVSAGDSHSAALSESGQVYVWGNFRNGNGAMGLVNEGAKQCLPVRILIGVVVVKISSGSDHLVCLSQEGIVYTCGCGDAGQLGRFTKHAVNHGVRKGRSFISRMLSPDKVPVGKSNKPELVKNIWTGSYATFASVPESGTIYTFGLNNYGQLGLQDCLNVFMPIKATSFSDKQWLQISGGQHHTLSLDDSGKVHSFGRSEYGRLGLGENTESKSEPTVIPLLEDKRCVDISSGNCVSLAVVDNGSVYSWGMGDNYQLGHGNDSDQQIPKLIEGNFFNSWKAFKIAGGGQHTLILANPRESLEESQ